MYKILKSIKVQEGKHFEHCNVVLNLERTNIQQSVENNMNFQVVSVSELIATVL